MRVSRIIVAVVVVAIVALIALFVLSYFVGPSSSGSTWVGGQDYPLQVSGTPGVVGQSCFNGTATIYCVGGIDYNGDSRNNVYSATVSAAGMSGWTAQGNYPQTVGLQSCVSSGGFAYCVGGSYDDAGDDVASSYFAPLTGSGIGSWNSTTSYPVAIDSQSCVASSAYIYCVAGENETSGTNSTVIPTSSAWFAPISSSGIGAWKLTTAYPSAVSFPACAASSSDIYCVGGVDSSDNGVSDVYYASLSSSGIGQWSATTAYPFDAYGQTCVIDSGSVICIGGVPNGSTSSSDGVYSAPITSSGLGSWRMASNYPVGIETACAVSSGNVYCAGGYQDSSTISEATYYAKVASLL